MTNARLILASTSPYRRELLQRLVPDFDCVPPEVDEDAFKLLGFEPANLARRLAFEKARAVAAQRPHDIVIGSDQVAEVDGEILGKPGTVESACRQLAKLSGRTHRLLTAVSIHREATDDTFVHETRLTMRSLSVNEIRRYVERDRPLDCAGGYRIEQLGIALFEHIETSDFTAIIGLPLLQVTTALRSLGLAVP